MSTSSTATKRMSRAQVAAVLRDIGYVLWISRKIADEIKAERSEPKRPEMAEFCAVETGGFVA